MKTKKTTKKRNAPWMRAGEREQSRQDQLTQIAVAQGFLTEVARCLLSIPGTPLPRHKYQRSYLHDRRSTDLLLAGEAIGEVRRALAVLAETIKWE